MRIDLWNSRAPRPPLQIDSLPQRTVAIDLSPCQPAGRLGLRKGEQSISPWRDDDLRTEAFQSKEWWLVASDWWGHVSACRRAWRGRVALLRDRRCTFIERKQAKGVNGRLNGTHHSRGSG